MNAQILAPTLGWFSIGLGLAEVGMAQRLGEFFGMREHTGLLRFFGMREIAAGLGILSQPTPEQRAPWLTARIGGDALDLLALGAALQTAGRKRRRVAWALAAVAGVTALDIVCRQQLSDAHASGNSGMTERRSPSL